MTPRWIGPDDDEEWSALFDHGFTESAFRLETMQRYQNELDHRAMCRFLAGEPVDMSDFDWILPKLYADAEAGRQTTVIRVVVEPPNDYTRWELSIYPVLDAAGRDTRVIAVPEGSWPPGIPDHDYWLFDSQRVWRMYYHADTTFRGAELLEGPDVLPQHLEWRDRALALSVPLDEYLSTAPKPP